MTRQRERLATGGRIDRARPLRFTFNGRALEGYAGDTLASALVANGISVVGRSIKYHRPRGIFAAGAEEPNAIVQLEGGAAAEPNARATRVEIYDGLRAESVNCWPSVEADFGAIFGLASALLPAGFYYKTFMWPAGLWMTYEALIRRMAGLGRAPTEADASRYDKTNAHCDVLVVGAGPAGLAAALSAARSGARVIVADEQNEPGGNLLAGGETIEDDDAMAWVAGATADLARGGAVRLLPRTTVFGYYHHNFLAALERVTDHLGPGVHASQPRQRLWRIRARQVVLATGALERPLVFAGNDRPGVMLADAARAYTGRYAARPGRRAVFFVSNDGAYRAALDLQAAGIAIAAIVDVRPEPTGELPARAEASGIEVIAGHGAIATRGRKRVREVAVAPLDASKPRAREARRIACDLLAVAGGWSPTVHLYSQSGGRLRFDETRGMLLPDQPAQPVRVAGAANGTLDLADCLAEGWVAGESAAKDCGFRAKARAKSPAAARVPEEPMLALWRVPSPDGAGESLQFVDLMNDVTAADVGLAVREGYASVEHLKRYTTLGMGTDQGKTANLAGLALLAQATGEPIGDVGHTTFRPPYTPVTYGALAGRDTGRLADPVRRTPMQGWHEQNGAVFEDVGLWRRPRFYPKPGEAMEKAVARECRAARNAIGLLDASTLGKLEVVGKDAGLFLDRIYTGDVSTLKPGRCRYGLMLRDDGMVFDDGVAARIDERRFLLTTTSGNAPSVHAWLEEWLQTEWPELEVFVASVTDQWATATLTGQHARSLLAEVAAGVDLSPRAFPFMTWRAGDVAGIPARIMRVSFTGELSYEINVAARYGVALWTALVNAGQKYGITPFGTEAMHVLRAEKGYIVVGHETDGTTTPADLGMERLLSTRNDFIGRRSLRRADATRTGRKQFVGLDIADRRSVPPEGSQIVETADLTPPARMIGHVTSACMSATLGRPIALALVKDGRRRMGETVHVVAGERAIPASLRDPVFFDAEGARLHG